MRKYMLLGVSVLALGAFGAAPAMAQAGNTAGNTAGSISGHAAGNAPAANNTDGNNNAQQLIDGAVKTVHMIKSDSRFEGMLKKAKGVFIMPTLVKAAFLVGGEGAQGVLLKRNSDGSWSDPAFLTIGAVSAGFEAGGKAGPAAFLLMTDKAVGDFTQANNFSLSAKSGLTVVGYSAQGQAPVGKGDIVVWSDQSGVFAGASLSGTDVTVNTTEDHTYYGKSVTPQQILASQPMKAGPNQLREALPG